MVYEAKPQKSDCCLLQRYSFDGISFSVTGATTSLSLEHTNEQNRQ